MKQFDSILVANRGEIAVRVIRAARNQGYRTIAVYSEADAGAMHVQLADEAVLIGAGPVKESYLDAEKILHAAKLTGAQAIHPGYGFLSENAEFSAACAKAGLVFIGPSAEAIELMGNKAAAKRRMLEAGVPCIPGYQSEDQSDAALIAAAEKIGAPIMVKAAAGGGGRGMRLVDNLDSLGEALASARSEAQNAFGSGELILEKAVLKPRHVEVQIFGDSHGNVIHLGERDCSVQRRHQKVVEEAPCPVMTPELREAMGQAAVDAAKNINYVGAGTVEFLLDADNNFYFLEMNTRLQVEHPVTEMITGQDLVAMQFQVAQGYPLALTQAQVALTGHAIEVRFYAEDTGNNFLPATGTANVWQPPQGEGIRVDHGLLEGQDISPFYDPMIAKIIAWGEDRDIARRRLIRALQNTRLFGVHNNREFLINVLQKPNFASGEATTAFIEANFSAEDLQPATPGNDHLLAAALLQYRAAQTDAQRAATSATAAMTGFGSNSQINSRYRYGGDDDAIDITVRQPQPGCYQLNCGDQTGQLQLLDDDGCVARLLFGAVQKTVAYCHTGRGEITVQINGVMQVLTNQLAFTRGDESVAGSGSVTAPMHGNVLEILVAAGEQVSAGQTVAVMEAMKMEHRLKAAVDGTVSALHAAVGMQLAAGALVLEIDDGG